MSNGQGLSGPANTWTSFTAKSTVVGGWAVAVSGKSAATATTTTIIKKLCGTFISVSFNVSGWPSDRTFRTDTRPRLIRGRVSVEGLRRYGNRLCLWGCRRVLGREVGEPLEPAGEVPVPLAEQLHRRRQQDAADEGGVDQHR